MKLSNDRIALWRRLSYVCEVDDLSADRGYNFSCEPYLLLSLSLVPCKKDIMRGLTLEKLTSIDDVSTFMLVEKVIFL